MRRRCGFARRWGRSHRCNEKCSFCVLQTEWRTAISRRWLAVPKARAGCTITTRCVRSRRCSVTMRDCPDGAIRDLLPLYVSGQLDDASQAQVETHLQGCADCAAEVELLRATVRAFSVKAVDAAAIGAKIPAFRGAPRARPFHSQPLWRVAAVITF